MPLFPASSRPETKPMKVSVTVWRGREESEIGESGLPLEIGRQSRGEDDRVLRTVQDHGNQYRIAIAEITVLGLPRHALRIEATDDGKLRCRNMHSQSTFHLTGRPNPVLPGEQEVVESEFVIMLPEDLTVRVSLVEEEPESAFDNDHLAATTPFRTIARDATSSDGDLGDFTLPINPAASFVRTFADDSNVNRGQAAVDLVRQALAVVKKSAGSDEFFETAVDSVARMVELDRAYVLLYDIDIDEWSVRAHFFEREQRKVPRSPFGNGNEAGSSSDTDVRSAAERGESTPKSSDTPMPSGSRLLLRTALPAPPEG